MLRRFAGSLLAVVVLLAGCSREAKKAEPEGVKTESFKTEAQVRILVKGATSVDFDGRTTIIIYRTLDERIPLGLRLFSVGLPDPGHELRKGANLRAAFDILGFKGDGEYTINKTAFGPTGSPSVQLPSGIQSNAFVQIFTPAEKAPIRRWDVALQPCTVRARDRARIGSLSCPSLRGDTNKTTVSLEMTWDATT